MRVKISESREQMGRLAALEAARALKEAVAQQGSARVAFAAAPSQDEFLFFLRQEALPWERVTAFHLDEYVGLPQDASQHFGAYLDEHLFKHVPLGEVHYLKTSGMTPEAAVARYDRLLGTEALELVCLGIGENGHLAFNDPHVADFADPLRVKLVDLDRACRQQQVNDGCFASLQEVPRQAITLTLPTLYAAKAIVCVVPGEQKNRAVKTALFGPLSPACPASILQIHPNTSLFLDAAAGAGVQEALSAEAGR